MILLTLTSRQKFWWNELDVVLFVLSNYYTYITDNIRYTTQLHDQTHTSQELHYDWWFPRSWGVLPVLIISHLVGGLEHVLFSIIYGLILPIDFHIFQGVGQPPIRQDLRRFNGIMVRISWEYNSYCVSIGDIMG